MKILILVLGTYASPYPALLRTIQNTWGAVRVSDVETIYYYGGDELAVDGDTLVLPVPDDLPHAGHKTAACFQYVLEHRSFDAVFRTNCSSYVDQANLRAYASELDSIETFYGGILGVRGSTPFASGSGYFLGRELIPVVLEHRGALEHKLADDQSLGLLLAEQGIVPQTTRRQDFDFVPRRDQVDVTQFHVRCRTDSFRRRRDRKIMRAVHSAFTAARAEYA